MNPLETRLNEARAREVRLQRRIEELVGELRAVEETARAAVARSEFLHLGLEQVAAELVALAVRTGEATGDPPPPEEARTRPAGGQTRRLVSLKTTDPMARDLLWVYAQRRRAVDPGFADDLEEELRLKGFRGLTGPGLRDACHEVAQGWCRDHRIPYEEGETLGRILHDAVYPYADPDRLTWREWAEAVYRRHHGPDALEGVADKELQDRLSHLVEDLREFVRAPLLGGRLGCHP